MNSESNIFEKIIKGDLPCYKVYEDENTLAFLDIQPNNIGHTLVVPKKHSRNFLNMKTEDMDSFFKTVQKVANAIKKALNADGINIVMNNEPAGNQEVFHTHAHIIPRHNGEDTFIYGKHLKYKEGEAEEVLEKIIREIKR